jgi:hypothetical protein
LHIDSLGNLGINVIPNAWSSQFKAIQFGNAKYGSISQRNNSTSELSIGWNVYNNSTGTAGSDGFVGINTGDASALYQIGGANHSWYVSNSSATAGSAVSWTASMTLNPSGNLLNTNGRPMLKQTGGILQTAYVSSTTRTSADFGANTWGEPSTDYRVTITPSSSSSYFIIRYFIPANDGGSWQPNTIFMVRAFRLVSGTKTYSLTSAGTQNSNRVGIAGYTTRPSNGYDGNDPMVLEWQVVDFPSTTSAVTYGFEFKREAGGTGTAYFGYSQGNDSSWGFDANPTIIVQEIAQ